MEQVEVSGVELDYCRDGCGGIWFDNFELKQLDEEQEGSGELLEEILNQSLVDDTVRAEKLTCPRCDNVKMRRHKYNYTSDVHVDQCYSCNGIWLDKGELAAIRANFESDEDKEKVLNKLISSNPEIATEMAKMEQQRQFDSSRISTRRSKTDRFFRMVTFGLLR
jgi:hypothetical protein